MNQEPSLDEIRTRLVKRQGQLEKELREVEEALAGLTVAVTTAMKLVEREAETPPPPQRRPTHRPGKARIGRSM